MKVLGLLALIGGIALSVFALIKMPTSAEYSDTLNIGLLQEQALIFHAGLALAVIGGFFIAAGVAAQAIIDTLADRAPSSD